MNVTVVGGGLAGVEAAYALASRGIKVTLYEMRPQKTTPAHKTENLAELVCSNSLKAMRHDSASGLLKEEMRLLGSLTLKAADAASVPAGGALAVDRRIFSEFITKAIENNPNITLIREEITEIPDTPAIIASGPLTSDKLSEAIKKEIGDNALSFYDAAAPIVRADSIDYDKVFAAARYGRGDDDYINCPFEKEEYEAFYEALISAETAELKEFEKQDFKVYEGCMPIEVMAKRGPDTLRFGPLKPVGLTNPKTGKRPYAVVQLRSEDRDRTNFNLVGFQTNLRFPYQEKVFRMIPGLEKAVFTRYGVMHRNTFLNSPKVLDEYARLKENLYFAGQITGVEGYMESAMSGIVAGINLYRTLNGKDPLKFPKETMIGALNNHISNDYTADFEPMGANMGILPPSEERIKGKKERYTYLADRAIAAMTNFLKEKEI
ncbi:MAG: methylenetetrahydrofolate--tRNA-(uracil(54)-C(5))-methyltransferase (FADH(2)-oxidizing) TrmFO [Oscillospiraceae bacterium]|nr:methylenetetrahydrofolate--tRNA-(uracil(54)-C(5))-methyltransferase (FADH(2)-oxidizing) TrmFO [Oscillospiraceae bacterium]